MTSIPRFQHLEPRLLLDGGVLITEFMASNGQTLLDGDGNASDWIEIYNPTDAPVTLDGWYLTDDSENLTKWKFPDETPDITIAPGGYLVVFASNGREDVQNPVDPYKDPAGNLHTSFKLSRNDDDQHESILLVTPIQTIEHGYEDYPEQHPEVSFGLEWNSTPSVVLAAGAAVTAVVPDVSYGGIGTAWTARTGYDDSSWSSGVTGVGFEATPTPLFGPLIGLDIEDDMFGNNASAYIRVPFTYGFSPDELLRLTLNIQYDDAFIAYLNGVKVAWANAPESPAYDSSADGDRDDAEALEFESFVIDNAAELIQTGSNVLAIHGLNASAGETDFLIVPELVALTGEMIEPVTATYFAQSTPGGHNVGAPENDPFKRIVINELHVNPEDNTKKVEFIELYNNTADTIDLSDWYFSDGVEFTFPADTSIPAGGYVVVGEDPAHVQSEFGISGVLGPFVGSLNNEGESVVLRDSSGARQDEVDYGWGFPWPTTGGSPGYSMELINPNMDNDLGGSWRISLGSPSPANTEATPAAENSVYATNAAPQTRQVRANPSQPAAGQATVITAKITDPDGVAAVDLHYQLVLPGYYIPAYLPLTHSQLMANPHQDRTANPEFENAANWSTVAMVDDGTGDDAMADDDIYTATVPAQINRTVVRYRITVADTFGASVRMPYADDPSLNFAYYVYDGVPDYVAGTRSVDPEGAGHVYSSEILTSLPVYSLIARAQDMVQMMAYSSGDQVPQTSDQAIRRAYNWQAAFVYDGVVYDHVDMRLRGANGRYHLAGKRSMRIRFKRGSYLQARDENGEEYPTKWRQLVVSKMFGNRQDINYGLAETINNEMWNLVGVPAPDTHWFHFRVVDGVEEVPAGANAQYYGDFWGMFMAFEPYDVRFLDAHDLPKGNLYKLTNNISSGILQQRYQAADAPVNAADYNNIRSNLNASRTDTWLYSNVNYDEWYRYHAVAEAIKHYDYWPGSNKNMAWYFEPDDENPMGRLWYLPFDSDASWGPTWNGGNDEAKAAISGGGGKPAMRMDYRSTIREIRDLIFQPDVIEPWIDRTAAIIEDFWQADYDRWEDAPSSAGTHNWNSQTLAWKVADMKRFAFVGGSWPGGGVIGGGQAAYLDRLANAEDDGANIPYTAVVTYVGPPGFAIDSLTFQCSSFSDPQGDGTFAAMEWRIGEITDPEAPAYDPDAPYAFEYAALWESGELTIFNDTVTIPGGSLAAGHAYRVRVRMKDATGRWSHWSAPVEFHTVDADAYVPENLRIIEMNYDPHGPTPTEVGLGYVNAYDFEFIELQNTGDKVMDLTGVRFTQGVTFDFTGSNVTALTPGQRVVVVSNEPAFTYRYGAGMSVAGEYLGLLNNTGEQIILKDLYNRIIADFAWSGGDSWPDQAEGKGATLEIIDPGGDYGNPNNWRSSAAYGGTPGAAAQPDTGIVVNEVLSHTDDPDVDTIELHNTTGAPVDIGGWFLSDSWGWDTSPDNGDYKKFEIPPGTTIPPGGYVVFYEGHYVDGALEFNPATEFGGTGEKDFALSAAYGDDVWLMKADGAGTLTHFADHLEFEAAANGESFGRWPNYQGAAYPMAELTFGSPNTGPRIGPAIINEIHYLPDDPDEPGEGVDADDYEFIEIYNPTEATVNLWETYSSVNYPWTVKGLGFATGTSLAPGERLVVVRFDPDVDAGKLADFKSNYGLGGLNIQIVGPYDGQLNDGGERVRLMRPDESPPAEPDFTPMLLVDEVTYDDVDPWPTEPNTDSMSLNRISFDAWGNAYESWTADLASPGTRTRSVAPTGIDLLAGSDTGASDIDDLTNLDNSGPAAALQYEVFGTIEGATVTVYVAAGEIEIALGSAVGGGGGTTIVTTTGGYDLADGNHSIFARQHQSDKIESRKSVSVTVMVDTQAPTLDTWYSIARHAALGEIALEIPDDGTFCEPRRSGISRLLLAFSEVIDPATFTPASIEISGLDVNNTPFAPTSEITISTPDAGATRQIDFASALPNVAQYVVDIVGVADVAGNAVESDADRAMLALIGNVSGDRRTDASDLSMAWDRRKALISPGDPADVSADVSGDGRISSSDLSIMWASRADASEIGVPAAPVGQGAAAPVQEGAAAPTAQGLGSPGLGLEMTVPAAPGPDAVESPVLAAPPTQGLGSPGLEMTVPAAPPTQGFESLGLEDLSSDQPRRPLPTGEDTERSEAPQLEPDLSTGLTDPLADGGDM